MTKTLSSVRSMLFRAHVLGRARLRPSRVPGDGSAGALPSRRLQDRRIPVRWPNLPWLTLMVTIGAWNVAFAQPPQPQPVPPGQNPAANQQAGSQPAPPPMFTEEREAAALVFLRKNQPDLLGVLEEVKAHDQEEYERAVCDFFRTSEMLASVRQQDPVRYDLALKGWQAETRTHLVAARLVRQPADAEAIKAELRQAVERLVDAHLEEMAYHIRHVESELERIRGQHQELKGRRDNVVRERIESMLQAIEQQRASRNGSAAKP